MVVSLLLKLIEVSDLHLLNAQPPIDSRLLGKVIDVNAVPSKALSSIAVTYGSSFTEARFEQFENALSPIDVAIEKILTEVSAEFANEFLPTDLTEPEIISDVI